MFGLNIDPRNAKGNPTPTELRELGVEMVRFTYADPGSGDRLDPAQLQFYRERVRAYRQAGIESLLILNYETYPHKPDPNAGEGEWDAYIDRLARRCGQIAGEFLAWQPAFQIWNEPDHPVHPGYAPTIREAVFGRMLRQANQAIKAVNGNLFVVAGGLAKGDPGWLERVVQAVGGNLPVDAIAVHPYGQRPARDWPRPDWFFGYVGDLLNKYYQVGGQRPIWITEMGVKEEDLGHNRDLVAEFLRRYYRLITTYYSNKVQQLIWFCYSDGMVAPFGLLDSAGTRKPAYQAYREVAPKRLQPVTPSLPVGPPVITPPVTPSPLPPPPPPIFPGSLVSPAGGAPPAISEEALGQLIQQAAVWQAQAQQLQNQVAQFQSQLQQLLNQQLQNQPGLRPPETGEPSVPPPPGLGMPPIQNITNQLKRDPNRQFPARPLSQIRRIIIHHTAIAPTIGAERIAEHRVDKQGWPGIGYHYFITPNGLIQQTNELTTQAKHAGAYDPVAIGICFAGDFTEATPSPAQIEAGAQLIAWLMVQFGLAMAAVNGYKELANTQSPGLQWDSGARWGDRLKARVQGYVESRN
ncbi:MAG: N-acetylmuramoyl-L-alanine amidase [Anaerolineae bacterium]|nr:N-acetylmuramoyl-L-alanine amidase [Anaerolineae bacterium]